MVTGAEGDIFNDITHLYKSTCTYSLVGCRAKEDQASKLGVAMHFVLRLQ
jgi:hypothetical protein